MAATNRALVTGATGYIASHLIPALMEAGWDVLATGRRREPPPLPDGVDYASANLVKDDPWVFSGLMERVTHVFHLAGASSSLSDQKEMEQVNIDGTRRLLQAAKPWPIERFVHMSSTSVYGEEVELPSPVPEDVERHPSRGYGKAKDGAERMVEESAAGGLPTVVVRPVTVYGPGTSSCWPAPSSTWPSSASPASTGSRSTPRPSSSACAMSTTWSRRPSTWPPSTAPSGGRSTSSCPSTRRATRWRAWWATPSACRWSW